MEEETPPARGCCRIRDIKRAKLEAATSSVEPATSGPSNCATSAAGPSTSATPGPTTTGPSTSGAPSTPATSEPASSSQGISSRPGADSENGRPDYSSSEEEFDSQDALDDWVTSLCLYDRKMLAVMFALTLQKRFKLTSHWLQQRLFVDTGKISLPTVGH